ncbi:hypothetical protein [Treponema putidum]|uniref:hypothetical protein n=1 Tax=Treponema putidum TaxID=221027 RepID=UPI0021036FA6|nr:hypothetical protein [Treponema putidum]
MKKIALVLFVVFAAFLIVSCSTVKPVAGASGVVGRKTGEASQAFFAIFPIKGEVAELLRLQKMAVLQK